MWRRSWALCSMTAAALLAAPMQADAQRAPTAGTIELGAFAQWSEFDGNAGRLNAVPGDGWGYGGRLGYFLSRALQLEADGYYSPQDRDPTEAFCCTGAQPTEVNASAIALRVNYNVGFGSSQFVIGGGGVRTTYSFQGGTRADSSASSFGVSGLAGLRIGLLDWLAARIDGVADYMPGHDPEANLNLHARAGLSLLLGGAHPEIAMAPPPPPPPPVLVDRPVAPAREAIRVCVVQGTRLAEIDAVYLPERGDTVIMVAGEPRAFASAHPLRAPDYAGREAWSINNAPIRIGGREYVSVGLTRTIPARELTRVGDHQGVGVFASSQSTAPHAEIYVPLRPGCEFQSYQLEAAINAVRG